MSARNSFGSHKLMGLVAGLVLTACSTTRPCTSGGDTRWDKKIKGDQTCIKTKLPDGREVNHGLYRQLYMNGKVAIEGSFFEGEKDGIWSEYDEKGKKTKERYFEKGIEKPYAPPSPKEDAPAAAPKRVR